VVRKDDTCRGNAHFDRIFQSSSEKRKRKERKIGRKKKKKGKKGKKGGEESNFIE
jgi:hypothetical protein